MKNYLLITLLLIVNTTAKSAIAFSGPSENSNLVVQTAAPDINKGLMFNSNGLPIYYNGNAKTATIDQMDSVVFDYSQAAIFGDTIEFPVSIHSDDTIYALDFSFKYDHNELVFDTIKNITAGLQSLYFYNTNDSTVRFTSNTLTVCTNDTVLVLVRFRMLNGQFNPAFINSIKGYLNGSTCSIKTTNYSAVGFDELEMQTSLSVYPNPSHDSFAVESSMPSTIQLFNLNGQLILDDSASVLQHRVNTENLSKGIYLLKITSGKSVLTRKVVVN